MTWRDSSGKFYNLDSVTFNDTGSAAPAVNVVGTIIPGAITVNNSVKDYTFGGSGAISGGTALSKLGTRTLTLAGTGTNTFTGPITVSGGGLTIAGTGGASLPGSVTVGPGTSLTVAGSGAVTLSGALNLNPGGTLTYNRSDSVACICALSGGGSFIQQGTGVLSLTADNSAFDGPIMVNAGTLKAGSATALGSINGATSVASGATFDVNGFKLGAETVTVPGAGVGGNGALHLAGTTAMKLDRANGTNDVLRTSGSITCGGMLTVTGLGGALVPGDTFKLFDAASYVPSSFATLNLPVGTTWDTSKLAVDGTIKVVSVSRPQVSGTTATSGSLRLTLSGPAGNNYSVWASTNAAATPVPSTWTPSSDQRGV